MHFKRTIASGHALFWAALGVGHTGALAQMQPSLRCATVTNGVEYRAYLPDGKRYVFVSVKALSGIYPSVFVMIDKSYETSGTKPLKDNPFAAWWTDRSKPMRFSSDTVKVRWPDDVGWHAMTGWLTGPDWVEVNEPIRGLEPDGKGFKGNGSDDANTYAFQTRVELQGYRGDAFDVTVPSVTFEGVTVAPPVVHFERTDDTISARC